VRRPYDEHRSQLWAFDMKHSDLAIAVSDLCDSKMIPGGW